MEAKVQKFRNNIIASGIVDDEGVHHLFSQGLHGQKVDFDKISDDSQLFKDWVELIKVYIKHSYSPLPELIVGVANGTNRLAIAVAESFEENDIVGVVSYKPEGSRNQPIITEEAKDQIIKLKPNNILILEDVGTRGTNSQSVALSIRQLGYNNLKVLNTWQRSKTLPLLDEQHIPYDSIIKEELPSYTPEQCEKAGFCSKNWKLLGHGQ